MIECNSTSNQDIPSSHGLIHHFLIQSHRFPNKPAIIDHDRSVTYQELVQNASNMACTLRKIGVTYETPVGIIMARGLKQITSQLGILMAGGTCVPLDPDMPSTRLNVMVDDLQIKWAIVTSPVIPKNLNTTLLTFSELLESRQDKSCISHSFFDYSITTAKHRTHVLFTSGTTGKPKGVQCEAKNIMNLVIDTHSVPLSSNDRIANVSSPVFDSGLFEIWGALLNGATIVTFSKEIVLNIQKFDSEITRNEITLLFVTTALFNLIASTYPQLFNNINYVLVGGEAMNQHSAKLVMKAGGPRHLINVYGPTECTTFTHIHEVKPEDLESVKIPIGKPIDRTRAFILNEQLEPVALGEIGHLYIAGDGLMRGYWNRDSPIINIKLPNELNTLRLYKTGDLSWQRPDGTYIYAGRVDHQVKLRGYRIELDDIEYHLLNSRQLQAAVVCIVKNTSSDSFLAAFIVPLSTVVFDKLQLMKSLKKYLPEYMIPRLFVISSVPLTPSGKADKLKLVAQLSEVKTLTRKYPKLQYNNTENVILQTCRKILNNADIDLDDNFFHLGGNSLQAARLTFELEQYYKKNLSVKILYEARNLRRLSELLSMEHTYETNSFDITTLLLKDSNLPDDILPLPKSMAPADWYSDSGTVFLTGATGFLGAFFLRDLITLTNIKKIICLVRATDETAGNERIKDNLSAYGLWQTIFKDRIKVIIGDLSLPQFGINNKLYVQLAKESDVIFHLGAHVNYIQPYQWHCKDNIEGTLNILRLATRYKAKPLHYVSTIGTFGAVNLLKNKNRVYENDKLNLYLESIKYDTGYSQSQWVVEKLIWKAASRGIPLTVYRPGFIMGDSISGAGNPNDFVARLIRGCIAIGAYPILPKQRKEFIPVNYVSKVLLNIAKNKMNLGRAFHIVPPDCKQSIEHNAFFQLLSQCDFPLQKLPYSDWVKQLECDPNLFNNPLMPLLPMLSEPVYQNKTRWEIYENMPPYDTSNTQSALAADNTSIEFTPMNKRLLSLYIEFWKKGGHIREKLQKYHS